MGEILLLSIHRDGAEVYEIQLYVMQSMSKSITTPSQIGDVRRRGMIVHGRNRKDRRSVCSAHRET